MLQLAKIHSAELPNNCRFVDIEQIKLIVCMRCTLQYDFFSYRLYKKGAGVNLLNYKRGRQIPGHVKLFPAQVPILPLQLKRVTKREQLVLDVRALDADSNDGLNAQLALGPAYFRMIRAGKKHQLGGRPVLEQGFHKTMCPECGRQMPFFAAFYFIEPLFLSKHPAHNTGAQASYYCCTRCSVLTGIVECD
jgi:hypothetical protein